MRNNLFYILCYLPRLLQIKLFLIFVFSFFFGFYEILSLIFFKEYIELITGTSSINGFSITLFLFGDSPEFALVSLFLVSIILISIILKYLLAFYLNKTVYKCGSYLNITTMNNILKLTYSSFINEDQNELIATLAHKNREFIYHIAIPLMEIFYSFIVLSIYMSYLFYNYYILATATSITFAIFFILINKLTKKKLIKNSEKISQKLDEMIKSINESIFGVKEIIVNEAQEHYLERFKLIENELREYSVSNIVIPRFGRYLIEALLLITLVLSTYYFLHLSEINLNEVAPIAVLTMIIILKSIPLLSQIFHNFSRTFGSKKVLSDIVKYLKKEPNFDLISKHYEYIPFENIYFKNVSFQYANASKVVFKNLNFEIHKGEVIGIFGKSGVGKSTFLNMAMGLLHPTSGKIFINNQIYKEENYYDIKPLYSYVSQNFKIFTESILQNITLTHYKDKINLNDIKKILEICELKNFIKQLPMGLHTQLKNSGNELSGGQKQRIAIARALFRNTPVLILDECTSALDDETSLKILKNIKKYYKNKSIIIVSHNSAIKNVCNKIFRVFNKNLIHI